MTYKYYIKVEADLLLPGNGHGNTEAKLIPTENWDEWSCVHRTKLRWACDDCNSILTCEWCQVSDHDQCAGITLDDTPCLCWCDEEDED